MTEEGPRLSLYTYWRSSAAYRVRIALNLKQLAYQSIPVHLVRGGGEQHSEAFLAVNPQGRVPVLVHDDQVLTQSMAICEYLDEQFGDEQSGHHKLLPDEPLKRAAVRSLALQVACEIHPMNNLSVQKFLQAGFGDRFDATAWMTHWMTEGFAAIEERLNSFDKGNTPLSDDHPGLFECFLVPQVYNADRFQVDMAAFPEICRIVSHCKALSAFIDAAPENQADAVP